MVAPAGGRPRGHARPEMGRQGRREGVHGGGRWGGSTITGVVASLGLAFPASATCMDIRSMTAALICEM